VCGRRRNTIKIIKAQEKSVHDDAPLLTFKYECGYKYKHKQNIYIYIYIYILVTMRLLRRILAICD
jgi:hypothetical protein